MTTRTGNKAQCSVCKKETRPSFCGGCQQNFCRSDYTEHLKILDEDLVKIENNYNELKPKFLYEKEHCKTAVFLEQLDQWKKKSIEIIEETAKECREKITSNTEVLATDIEEKMNNLDEQLRALRDENDFNEIDLNESKQKLKQIKEKFHILINVSIQQQSTTFISKFLVNIPFNKDAKWKQEGSIIAGGNQRGDNSNQLDDPCGICIDDDSQAIYIADTGNHRIMEWKPNALVGRIAADGNQLNEPTDIIIDKETNSFIIADSENRRVVQWSRKRNTKKAKTLISDIDCCCVTMDKDRSIYVSNKMKNEVRRWKNDEKKGTLIAGGNGQGDQLNQLHFPTDIFVDQDYSLYISDSKNHRVMKWVKDAKEGIIVAGGHGRGNGLEQLSSPGGIIVDHFGQIYVADVDNHRVMCWGEEDEKGTIIIGGNGEGDELNQLHCPDGLSFDRQGNLCVVDCWNNRIQKFEIDSN